jgi:hypothetical protein
MTDDTVAVRKATQALADGGQGGVLLFPAGHTFLTASFNLTSNTLMLLQGNILFSPNIAAYQPIQWLPSYGTGREEGSIEDPRPRYEPLLGAFSQQNITISTSEMPLCASCKVWVVCARIDHLYVRMLRQLAVAHWMATAPYGGMLVKRSRCCGLVLT